MHIAIEGIDGIGKTTVALMLAETLRGIFIEKPLQYLLGGRKKYEQLAAKLNMQASADLRAWFHGFGDMYFSHYLADGTVVTDHYFLSNWVRNSTADNIKIFDVLAGQIRPPDYTFLLAADMDVLREHAASEKPAGDDSRNLMLLEDIQRKYAAGLERYGFPHTVIHCSQMAAREVHQFMIRILQQKDLFTEGNKS